MGLFYVFPIQEDESPDHVQVTPEGLLLRTYGPPYIFWWYLLGIILILCFMALGTYSSLLKLWHSQDSINQILCIAVWSIFILLPIVLLGGFFFEKILIKNGEQISIAYRIFFLKFYEKKIFLKNSNSFKIHHFLESANQARINSSPDFKAFENKGYFELFAEDKNGNLIFLDRHSQRHELKKLRELLETS